MIQARHERRMSDPAPGISVSPGLGVCRLTLRQLSPSFGCVMAATGEWRSVEPYRESPPRNPPNEEADIE